MLLCKQIAKRTPINNRKTPIKNRCYDWSVYLLTLGKTEGNLKSRSCEVILGSRGRSFCTQLAAPHSLVGMLQDIQYTVKSAYKEPAYRELSVIRN